MQKVSANGVIERQNIGGCEVNNKPRILFYDLETSHNLAAIFSIWDDHTPHTNILQERFIISVAWRWLGEKKIHAASILDDPKRYAKDPCDDKYVVETLHGLLSEADVIVAHNGDAYDYKYFLTRNLYHGLPTPPPVATIDTCKIAKQKFLFNCNKLDYLGKFLGFGGKTHTPPGLWLEVLRGSKKAIKVMVEYNKRDVELLEKIFLKLRPYIPNHLNRELLGKDGCPRCGSKKMQSRGYHRAVSRVYRRFQCQKCHGWSRAVVNEKDIKPQYRIL